MSECTLWCIKCELPPVLREEDICHYQVCLVSVTHKSIREEAPEEVFNIGDLLFTKHKQKDSYTKWDDNADTTRTSKINYIWLQDLSFSCVVAHSDDPMKYLSVSMAIFTRQISSRFWRF